MMGQQNETGVLHVHDLSKAYLKGTVKALQNFSASFGSGVYGILGPNGAGKSTLFKLLTGTLIPDAGQVAWEGGAIQEDLPAYKAIMGYMPQQQQLYPEMSLAQFLHYFAVLKNLDRAQAKAQVAEVMEKTGLTALRSTRIAALSGEMKQRVLISQALLGDPRLMILDEPTAGLDPLERVRVRNFISHISINKTVLIATHVVSDIECIAKQVLFIKSGQLILSGSPMDILSAHQGKVFQGEVRHQSLPALIHRYNVTHLQETAKGSIAVRVCGDFDAPPAPEGQAFAPAEPTLTDVYLYLYGKQGSLL